MTGVKIAGFQKNWKRSFDIVIGNANHKGGKGYISYSYSQRIEKMGSVAGGHLINLSCRQGAIKLVQCAEKRNFWRRKLWVVRLPLQTFMVQLLHLFMAVVIVTNCASQVQIFFYFSNNKWRNMMYGFYLAFLTCSIGGGVVDNALTETSLVVGFTSH